MRVPDLIFYLFFDKENSKIRKNVEEKYLEIVSGNRLQAPSEDPAATNQILNLKTEISKLSQFSRNRLFADTVLSYADTLLAEIEDRLKSLYSRVIQLSNQVYTPEQLKAAAKEFEEALKLLLNTANEKIVNNYVFSGNALITKPFDENTYNYNGGNADFEVLVEDGYKVSVFLNGGNVFSVDTGDPAVDNVFKVINEIKTKLENGNFPEETDIQNLEKAYTKISEIRTKIGSVLKELRNERNYQEDRKVVLEKQKSDVEDADLAKSISEYERYRLVYDAIMKLFVNHKNMTILDYI